MGRGAEFRYWVAEEGLEGVDGGEEDEGTDWDGGWWWWCGCRSGVWAAGEGRTRYCGIVRVMLPAVSDVLACGIGNWVLWRCREVYCDVGYLSRVFFARGFIHVERLMLGISYRYESRFASEVSKRNPTRKRRYVYMPYETSIHA